MNKNIPWISSLSILVLLQGIFLFGWTARDMRPTSWDESIHVNNAMEYADRISGKSGDPLFHRTYFDYPPLYHLALIPFLNAADSPNDAGAPLNFLFYLLLVASVFLWGRFLRDDWTGVVAAALVSAYPVVIQMMRFPLIDVPLTAMVSISLYALARSDNFKYLKWSLIFGVLAGFAQMTKMTAFLYMTAPVLWGVYQAAKGYRLGNVVWAAVLGFLITAPWYLPNFTALFVRSLDYVAARPASGIELKGFLSWLWYPLALFRQINWILVLVFLPGFVLAFAHRKGRFLLLWLLGSFVLLSLMHNRNIRYSMPALPAVALLSALWLPPPRRWTNLGVLLGAVVVFFTYQTLGGPTGQFHFLGVPIPLLDGSPPVRGDWKHDEIIDSVQKKIDPDAPFSRIITLSNHPSLHSTTLNVSLRRKGIETFSFKGPSKRRWTEFAEFILVKSHNLGPDATNKEIRDYAAFVQDPDPWFKKVFKPVDEFDFPDGSKGILLKANPQPVSAFDLGLLNLSLREMKIGRITAENVVFRVVSGSFADARVGKFREIRIKARRLFYKKFLFEDVGLILKNPQINLPLFLETQQLQFLRLEEMSPSAVLPTDSILAYAEKKLNWLTEPTIVFDGPVIEIAGVAGRIPLELAVRAALKDSAIQTELVKMKVARIPVPVVFFRSLTRRTVPLTPNREMPFTMNIKTLEGKGDRFVIGS